MARTSSNSVAKESEGGFGPKSIAMLPDRFSWKEDGRKRDFSILAGRMEANARLVTQRKVQKSTGFTTVQVGMK